MTPPTPADPGGDDARRHPLQRRLDHHGHLPEPTADMATPADATARRPASRTEAHRCSESCSIPPSARQAGGDGGLGLGEDGTVVGHDQRLGRRRALVDRQDRHVPAPSAVIAVGLPPAAGVLDSKMLPPSGWGCAL
jgi:hypothetical protein